MKSKPVQRYGVVDCWILPMSIDDMNVEIVKKASIMPNVTSIIKQ